MAAFLIFTLSVSLRKFTSENDAVNTRDEKNLSADHCTGRALSMVALITVRLGKWFGSMVTWSIGTARSSNAASNEYATS